MSIQDQLKETIKQSMRNKEKDKLTTLRMVTAAIKQHEVDKRENPTEADVVKIIEKMIKQRKEASSQFRQADRSELADKEDSEIQILKVFLPEQLSESEILIQAKEAVSQAGATEAKDMGKVMAILKPALAGKADMSLVSKCVKSILA